MRIVINDAPRHDHQADWPMVEAEVHTSVVRLHSWGRDRQTLTVVARYPIDIREDGPSQSAIELALVRARQRAEAYCKTLHNAHPHTDD